MRENFEVVREIALALSLDNDPRGFQVGRISGTRPGTADAEAFSIMIENDLTAQEAYYFDLMEERGLVRFLDNRTRVHLTADGQDFVHSVSDKKVWDKIKEWINDTPFDLREIKKSARNARVIQKAARISEDWK